MNFLKFVKFNFCHRLDLEVWKKANEMPFQIVCKAHQMVQIL